MCTVRTRGLDEFLAKSVEPHVPQNQVSNTLLESAFRARVAGEPLVTSTLSEGTCINEANALEESFGHSMQWHVYAT